MIKGLSRNCPLQMNNQTLYDERVDEPFCIMKHLPLGSSHRISPKEGLINCPSPTSTRFPDFMKSQKTGCLLGLSPEGAIRVQPGGGSVSATPGKVITPHCFSPEGATGKKTELYVLAPQLPLRKRRGGAGFRNIELIIQRFPIKRACRCRLFLQLIRITQNPAFSFDFGPNFPSISRLCFSCHAAIARIVSLPNEPSGMTPTSS